MRTRLLLLLCLTAAVSLADGRRCALFIGINDYTAPEIADLRFAVADVTTLADALTGTPALAFAKDDVFLMTDTVKDAAYLPKQANILVRLDLLRQQLKPDDLFLFYFAGHGLEYEGEYYLLTQDSDIRAKTALERSALRLSDVRKLLDTIPSRQRLLFFDACREDPRAGSRGAEGQNVLSEVFVRGVRPRLETGEATRSELTAAFFATQQGQRSYEWPSQGHGFFSYYLAQGLRGEAAQVDGRLTLDSLEAYLAQAVPAATRREINQLQTPWVDRSGAGGAELVLAVYPPRNLEQVAGSAKLKVLSTPPGAPVIVDNEMVGVTPCEAEVDLAGQPERVVEIAVTRQGYRTEMRRLKLTRGQAAEVDVGEMVKRPVRQVLTGSLVIRTDPPGAQVVLDGLEAGRTPFTDPFSTAGTHRVALLLAGRATVEREVTVTAGRETPLELKLEAQPATLIVDTTPPGATVMVNGEKKGETPVAVSGLPPGEYTVELILNGFETQKTTVGLAAGVVVPIKAVMVSAQAGDALADPVFDRKVTVKAVDSLFRAVLAKAAADVQANLIVDDAVTDRLVNLTLTDVPLRDVCRVLLATYGLQMVRRGDVYAVVPREADFAGGTVVRQGTAELLVESEPAGATVEWEGKPVGTTPLRYVVELPAGQQKGGVVRVLTPGHQAVTAWTRLQSGRATQLGLYVLSKLEPARLVVNSQPSGAGVYLDGAKIGSTPFAGTAALKSEAEYTELRLEVRLEGYLTERLTAQVRSSGEVRWAPVLRQGVRIGVRTRAGNAAWAEINGVRVGSTPWVGELESDAEGAAGSVDVKCESVLGGAVGRAVLRVQPDALAVVDAIHDDWTGLLQRDWRPPAGLAWDVARDGGPMVYIPEGAFMMGSPPGTGYSVERPRRSVHVSGFWIHAADVTVRQYREFCRATGRNEPPVPRRWDWHQDHPVVNVSWEDARAYSDWAGLALPTEAQWERAARGGTTTSYSWGNRWDSAQANGANAVGKTTPAGAYPANGYGLFDMAGNVCQWCEDWYDASWYVKMPDRDPCNRTPARDRVCRGGSWLHNSGSLRAADRNFDHPAGRRDCYGFRCAQAQ